MLDMLFDLDSSLGLVLVDLERSLLDVLCRLFLGYTYKLGFRWIDLAALAS